MWSPEKYPNQPGSFSLLMEWWCKRIQYCLKVQGKQGKVENVGFRWSKPIYSDIALVWSISRYNLLYSKFSLGHFSAIFDDSQHFTYRCHVFFVNADVLVVNFNWKYPPQTNQTNPKPELQFQPIKPTQRRGGPESWPWGFPLWASRTL